MMISFIPSLRHAAIVSVISSLIKQRDWHTLSQEYDEEFEISQAAAASVKKKIPKLPLPERLKTEICNHVEQVFEKITDWVSWGTTHFDEIYHENFFSAICLTNMGTVDKKKSVELLLKNRDIDLEERYHLACACCLEEHIRKLWLKLSNRYVNYSQLLTGYKSHIELVKYWTYKMKPDMNKKLKRRDQYYPDSEMEYFGIALDNSNSLAAHYFWSRLSLSQKVAALHYEDFNWEEMVICAWPTSYVEFLFLTLPLVDREQQDQWFRSAAFHILEAFMEWPWCYFLVTVAESLYDYLSAADYLNLLDNFLESDDSHDCLNIAAEILRTSPQPLRRSIFDDKRRFCNILFTFLLSDNTEGANFLISDLDTVVKEQLVFSDEFRNECPYFDEEEFKTVISFVCKCVPSKEKRVEWIHQFKQHLVHEDNICNIEHFLSLI